MPRIELLSTDIMIAGTDMLIGRAFAAKYGELYSHHECPLEAVSGVLAMAIQQETQSSPSSASASMKSAVHEQLGQAMVGGSTTYSPIESSQIMGIGPALPSNDSEHTLHLHKPEMKA